MIETLDRPYLLCLFLLFVVFLPSVVLFVLFVCFVVLFCFVFDPTFLWLLEGKILASLRYNLRP